MSLCPKSPGQSSDRRNLWQLQNDVDSLSMVDEWPARRKGWKFGEMLRNHNLQRNPTRLTYTIYFIQFLGPTYMGKSRDSPPGIIATSVKSGRLQNEDTWLHMTFSLQRSDWHWLGHVPFSHGGAMTIMKRRVSKLLHLDTGLEFFLFFVFCILCSASCFSCFHLPLQHSWETQGDQMTRMLCCQMLDTALEQEFTHTCCIICHSKSWQPPPLES